MSDICISHYQYMQLRFYENRAVEVVREIIQYIYVLQCENGKYYVGKTLNVDRRLAEHFSGAWGSDWTSYYPPQEVIEVENMTSEFDEMKKTLEYMRRFGIDNVRGAQWSNINLTSQQKANIATSMNTNGCFHCGEPGHFSNNCSNRPPQVIQCGNYGHFANECNNNRRMVMHCERCGRNSHLENNCHATFDIDGQMLDCARCGRDSHCADNCFANYDINRRRLY